jgi:hypothetical protein
MRGKRSQIPESPRFQIPSGFPDSGDASDSGDTIPGPFGTPYLFLGDVLFWAVVPWAVVLGNLIGAIIIIPRGGCAARTALAIKVRPPAVAAFAVIAFLTSGGIGGPHSGDTPPAAPVRS